ncbi:MAG: hypothetical protein ACI8RZ_001224, partial [Myxococcota bacterium]
EEEKDDEGDKQATKEKVTQPDVVLDELIIIDSTATQGGGVYASGCVDLEIDDSLIEGNSAEQGGGIYIGVADESEVSFLLDDSTVTGNTATQGGGLWAGASWGSVYDSIISDNTAEETGGGVQLSGTLYVYTSYEGYTAITGNTADQGGGVYFDTDSWLYSTNTDWGGAEDKKTGETAADNTPDDVDGPDLTDAPYSFGVDEDFDCTDKEGCVVDEDKKKKKKEEAR